MKYMNCKISFGEKECIDISQESSLYKLNYCNGTEASDCALDFSRFADSDGATYNSVSFKPRLITLCFDIVDVKRSEEIRLKLISSFNPMKKGLLIVNRSGVERSIDCYIYEKPSLTQETIDGAITVTLKLFCPDPFFKDPVNTEIQFRTFKPLLTFPFNSTANVGISAGIMTISDTFSINNNGDMPIGILCTIDAYGGSVSNPKITCNGKFVRVIKTLTINERIGIDTRHGMKNIYLNGTPVFLFDRASVFFSLPTGNNTISITADAGLDNAKASVAYALKYLGV